MITIVFLLLLTAMAIVLAATGAGPEIGATQLAIVTILFVVFFLSGIYVAAALGILALLASLAFSDRPIILFAGEVAWGASTNFILVAVPLFLLMSELLLRAGLSHRLYRTLHSWLGNLPGGLLHTNIASCALFSAVCGSSVATAATIGSVALPYFEKTRYSQKLVLGSLAAGGALGNLIPPAIGFLLYGLLTDTSIGKLYAGGFAAGFIVTFLSMLYIFVHSLITKSQDVPVTMPWRERLVGLRDLLPTLVLFFLVVGTIYVGIATPTEAAALGVVGALGLAALYGHLNPKMLDHSVRATARTTAFVGLILVGAFVLNYILASIRLPQMMARMVADLPFAPWMIMSIIIMFYIALGTFMEGSSMMITTLPVVFPIVTALGYDPVWFGVVMVMLVEVAVISPPDGMVLYVLHGLRTSPGSITDVFIGVLPFVLIYCLSIVLFMVWPGLVLWLPSLLSP